MRALILFGSESDKPIYNALLQTFDDSFETIFEIISAHRQPERLNKALQEYKYDFVVAGAGLAAHLPGVVASLTPRPVFGIPVAANFSGLDAFLSIVQMPKGVPVLCCHPKNYWSIANFATFVFNCSPGSISIVSKNVAAHEQLISNAIAQHPDVNFEIGCRINNRNVNIVLVENEDDIVKSNNVIHLPMYGAEDKKDITKALEFFTYSEKGGFWVGANNIINAINFYKRFWGSIS